MKNIVHATLALSMFFAMALTLSCGTDQSGQDKQEQEMQAKEDGDKKMDEGGKKSYEGEFDCEDLLKRYRKLIADINEIDGKTTEDHKKVLIYRTKEIYDEIQYYLDDISPECVKKIEKLDKEFEQIAHKLK